MERATPILADMVFLGGGHAQVAAIKSFAMRPEPGLRLTIVTSNIHTPYSGMLPGYVEGVWNDDDIHIDLARLAQFANARLIVAECSGIDAAAKQLVFADRPPLHFDVLSVNIGGQPDLNAIEGAGEFAIPVKPIGGFQKAFDSLEMPEISQNLAVIGGGAAGCELALALSRFWRNKSVAPDMTLYSRSSMLLPQMAKRAGRLMQAALGDADIKVQLGNAVTKIEPHQLQLSDGYVRPFDHCFLVSAVAPPVWLRTSGLALDIAGFITVNSTLQSTSHPYIFAAGDIATITGAPRPKAGVFAVRAGPVLAKNLRAYIHGKRLKNWAPQKHYVAIISTADGKAIACRGNIAVRSAGILLLKHWIDRRFMQKYQSLNMPLAPAPVPFSGLDKASASMPSIDDPAYSAMRCLGCAAKASRVVLADAIAGAIDLALSHGADTRLMPDTGLESDAAHLPTPPPGHNLLQSVDTLSEIISDPFVLGRIAAIHALSDLYATLATPTTAMAMINLPEASFDVQRNQLMQILAGALMAFSDAGVALVGGHTSEGGTLGVGFSVIGHVAEDGADMHALPLTGTDLRLVLTKPVGTGIIMAANMRLSARGQWVNAAVAQMLKSNADAARIFAGNKVIGATDITGFGLARHAQNLASRLGFDECLIAVDAVPLLDGVTDLLATGIRSSLHDQNRAAVNLDTNDQPEAIAVEALFDPQTSGGLLGVFDKDAAQDVVNKMRRKGHVADIIGALTGHSASRNTRVKIVQSLPGA